ncbi:thiolase, N-terminal domain protein, partial [Vibrio parahaemolyticus V-223/04]
KWAIWS